MSLNRLGLEGLVPVAKLLAPQLLLKHLLRTAEAAWSLVVRHRSLLDVRETVHIRIGHRVEQQPVKRSEFAASPRKGLGVHLCPVTCHRTWEMNGVELPRAGARRLEAELGGCL